MNAWDEFAERYSPDALYKMHGIVDETWRALALNVVPINCASSLDEVMELLPEEQDEWAPLHVYADHALASLAYTIRCLLSSNAQEAAWAARRTYEAADQAAIRQLDIQPGTVDSESLILRHEIVQRELERQALDLQTLERNSAQEVLSHLKSRAFSEHTLTRDEMLL